MKSGKIWISAVLIVLLAIWGGFLWLAPPKSKPVVIQVQPEGAKPIAQAPSTMEGSPALRFAFSPGETLGYTFELYSQADIDLSFLLPPKQVSAAMPRKFESLGKGKMVLTFFPSKGGGWDVAARLLWSDYRINGESPEYSSALASPFAFHFQDNGEIDLFRFQKGASDSACKVIQQVVKGMQLLVSQTAKREWSTQEKDGEGVFRAHYTVTSDDSPSGELVVHKRKEQYLFLEGARLSPEQEAEATQGRIAKSDGVFRLQRNSHWIDGVNLQETSVRSRKGRDWARGKVSFTAQRQSGVKPLFFSLAELEAALVSDALVKAQFYQTDATLDRLGVGVSMEEMLKLCVGLFNGEDKERAEWAERLLVNYLRQFPQRCFQLVKLLDRPQAIGLNQSTELHVWNLLTRVGHREAQQATVVPLFDPEYGTATRYRALSYFHDFAHPEKEVTDRLLSFADSVPAIQSQEASELRAMALYAVGTAGGPDKLNEPLQQEISTQLAARLNSSQKPGDQAVALLAIGNQGDEKMLPVITPYLSSRDDMVRANAYDALRRMPGEAAVDLLISTVATESSSTVRVAAIKTLNEMPDRGKAVDWARRELAQVSIPAEQVVLIDFLGKSLKENPENEGALRQLLAQNPVRQVKKKIYQYIAPM